MYKLSKKLKMLTIKYTIINGFHHIPLYFGFEYSPTSKMCFFTQTILERPQNLHNLSCSPQLNPS